MQQRGISDRERNSALTNATGHNRQNDKEEDLEGFKTERHAHAHSDNHADDFTAQHREENAQEALN
ncbi:hypothetical protein D3C87_1727460 [compost metagenome]